MQGTIEPVAAAVAGEHATGAVATVRRRRETDDEKARLGIAKTRQRFAPVFLHDEAFDFLPSDLFAPGDQPRAETAADDFALQAEECRGVGGVHERRE